MAHTGCTDSKVFLTVLYTAEQGHWHALIKVHMPYKLFFLCVGGRLNWVMPWKNWIIRLPEMPCVECHDFSKSNTRISPDTKAFYMAFFSFSMEKGEHFYTEDWVKAVYTQLHWIFCNTRKDIKNDQYSQPVLKNKLTFLHELHSEQLRFSNLTSK